MRRWVLSIFMLALTAHSAVAQDAPIEMIPASASVVIRLQAPETTIEELAAFINKVQPGFGDLAKSQFPNVLGQAVSNPTLAGIDQSKDWYSTLFADDDGQMKDVLLLPTIDAEEAKNAMGTKFHFVEKDGWLVCSRTVQFRDEFAGVRDGSVKSIAASLDERTKSSLNSGHLCVVKVHLVQHHVQIREVPPAGARPTALQRSHQLLGDNHGAWVGEHPHCGLQSW